VGWKAQHNVEVAAPAALFLYLSKHMMEQNDSDGDQSSSGASQPPWNTIEQ